MAGVSLGGRHLDPLTPYTAKLLQAFMDEIGDDRQFTYFRGRDAEVLACDPLLHAWLWTDFGRVVAYGHIELSANPHKAHVGRLGVCVAPDHRGNGLGKQIVGTLLHTAGSLGLEKVVATVYGDNAPMLHIYRDCFGFTQEGRYVDEEQWGEDKRDVISLGRFL